MEEKLLDQIIEILALMNVYTPTTPAPANPNLSIIRSKLVLLQAARLATKKKFALNFLNIADVTKQISSINFK